MNSQVGCVSPELQGRLNDLSQVVLNTAITVHRAFGPGLLESAYEGALFLELQDQNLRVERQVPVEATWRGQSLGTGFRADLIVEQCLLIELKSVQDFDPVHVMRVHTYLKLLRFHLGLLINFNKPNLVDGFKRVANRM